MKRESLILNWCALTATVCLMASSGFATTCQANLLYTRIVLAKGDRSDRPLTVKWADPSLVPPETLKLIEKSRVLPAVIQVIGDRVHSGQENPLKVSARTKNAFRADDVKNFSDFEISLKRRSLPSYQSRGPIEMKGGKAGPSSVQRLRIGKEFMYFRPAEPEGEDDLLGAAKLSLVRKTFIVDGVIRRYFPNTHHFLDGKFAIVNGKRGWLSREINGEVEKAGIFQKCSARQIYFMEAIQFLLNNPDLDETHNLALENGHLINFDVDFALQPAIALLKSDSQGRLSPRIAATLPDFYPAEFVDGLELLAKDLEKDVQEANAEEIYYLQFRAHVILADIANRGPGVVLPPEE